jgi:hypothetical protein
MSACGHGWVCAAAPRATRTVQACQGGIQVGPAYLAHRELRCRARQRLLQPAARWPGGVRVAQQAVVQCIRAAERRQHCHVGSQLPVVRRRRMANVVGCVAGRIAGGQRHNGRRRHGRRRAGARGRCRAGLLSIPAQRDAALQQRFQRSCLELQQATLALCVLPCELQPHHLRLQHAAGVAGGKALLLQCAAVARHPR